MKITSNKNNRTRKNRANTKKYIPISYSYLLGKVKGIDDKLLKIHFKLYEGLVYATNDALQYIHNCSIHGVKNMVEYRGVQKELAFFFNGMRLHELYFGIMCGENMNKMDPNLVNDINKNFGSFAKWKANFIETGRIPGVGFVALCRDRSNGLLFNNWINEFDIGAQLIGTDIILVMDMWEHAYIAEFGLDLKKYCETYLNNVNWSVVSTLYNDSLHKKINHLFVK
jgi:Fe-Mn family superoxide dismutase